MFGKSSNNVARRQQKVKILIIFQNTTFYSITNKFRVPRHPPKYLRNHNRNVYPFPHYPKALGMVKFFLHAISLLPIKGIYKNNLVIYEVSGL